MQRESLTILVHLLVDSFQSLTHQTFTEYLLCAGIVQISGAVKIK